MVAFSVAIFDLTFVTVYFLMSYDVRSAIPQNIYSWVTQPKK